MEESVRGFESIRTNCLGDCRCNASCAQAWTGAFLESRMPVRQKWRDCWSFWKLKILHLDLLTIWTRFASFPHPKCRLPSIKNMSYDKTQNCDDSNVICDMQSFTTKTNHGTWWFWCYLRYSHVWFTASVWTCYAIHISVNGRAISVELLLHDWDQIVLLVQVKGEWKLVYSTISILGSKRTKLGLRDFIALGDFVQIIDVDQVGLHTEISEWGRNLYECQPLTSFVTSWCLHIICYAACCDLWLHSQAMNCLCKEVNTH